MTPHLHLVVAEAQWEEDGTVVPVAAPSDEDVARILARVLSQTKKDWATLEEAWPEDDFEALQARAIQEPLGLSRRSVDTTRDESRCGWASHCMSGRASDASTGLEGAVHPESNWVHPCPGLT